MAAIFSWAAARWAGKLSFFTLTAWWGKGKVLVPEQSGTEGKEGKKVNNEK